MSTTNESVSRQLYFETFTISETELRVCVLCVYIACSFSLLVSKRGREGGGDKGWECGRE